MKVHVHINHRLCTTEIIKQFTSPHPDSFSDGSPRIDQWSNNLKYNLQALEEQWENYWIKKLSFFHSIVTELMFSKSYIK